MIPFPLQQLTLAPRTRQVIYLVIVLAWVATQALTPALGTSSRLIVSLNIAIPLLAVIFLGVAAAHVYAAGPIDPSSTSTSSSDAAAPTGPPAAPSTPVNPTVSEQATAPAWTQGNGLTAAPVAYAPPADPAPAPVPAPVVLP